MSEEINQKINCTDCGELLPKEWINSNVNESCPACSSTLKTISIDIIEDIGLDIKESLLGTVKDINYNSKRNPRYEFFKGDDIRKSDGKWMKKSRVVDKYNDKYLEQVVDPETDEVIHHCEEALSYHFNHGSAKHKKR